MTGRDAAVLLWVRDDLLPASSPRRPALDHLLHEWERPEPTAPGAAGVPELRRAA